MRATLIPLPKATTLSKITADLYQFGVSICEAKGAPLSWLRVVGINAEELTSEGFVICRDSWRAKYKRYPHPEAAPRSYFNLVVLAWGTARVWLEAPSQDDLREVFGSWRAPQTTSKKPQTRESFAQPRILLGAYTCYLKHDLDSKRVCKRGCDTEKTRFAYSYCQQYQAIPAPLPEGAIQDQLL